MCCLSWLRLVKTCQNQGMFTRSNLTRSLDLRINKRKRAVGCYTLSHWLSHGENCDCRSRHKEEERVKEMKEEEKWGKESRSSLPSQQSSIKERSRNKEEERGWGWWKKGREGENLACPHNNPASSMLETNIHRIIPNQKVRGIPWHISSELACGTRGIPTLDMLNRSLY